MAILLEKDSRVIIQGANSRYAAGILQSMRAAGTNIVAGVAPGRGGTADGALPLFDTVAEARAATDADCSVLFVPPPALADAVVEAAEAGIRLAVVATEYVPVHDAMAAAAAARAAGMWLIGPNTLGLYAPGLGMLGALPVSFGRPGPVGIISRSGTLTIEMMRALAEAGIGISTAVSVGGDLVIGRRPAEYLRLFDEDPQTRALVYIGEIGSGKENELAGALASCTKPVLAMIVGRNAPEGRQLGHAGALVGGAADTAAAKIARLEQAGAEICAAPGDVPARLGQLLADEVSPC